MAPPILKVGALSLARSGGSIDHSQMDRIRPYMLVVRKNRNEWVISEIGEKSVFAMWFGHPVARSKLGRLPDLGAETEAIVSDWQRAYNSVHETGGSRYEHCSLCMPRKFEGPSFPLNYQRLLAACKFANGEVAVAVIVAATDSVEIPGLPEGRFVSNSPELLMEFEP